VELISFKAIKTKINSTRLIKSKRLIVKVWVRIQLVRRLVSQRVKEVSTSIRLTITVLKGKQINLIVFLILIKSIKTSKANILVFGLQEAI
jgi:hypothetical protein